MLSGPLEMTTLPPQPSELLGDQPLSFILFQTMIIGYSTKVISDTPQKHFARSLLCKMKLPQVGR